MHVDCFQTKSIQHTSNQHLTVTIQGKQVTNVTDEKLLRVQIANNLFLETTDKEREANYLLQTVDTQAYSKVHPN